MKRFFFLLLSFAHLQAVEPQGPEDQLLVIFGASGYVLFKVLDFANDHGFRYTKILSYEFAAFDHKVVGGCTAERPRGGFYFELNDDNAKVSFLCFKEKPSDPAIIDLEKYRRLLEHAD